MSLPPRFKNVTEAMQHLSDCLNQNKFEPAEAFAVRLVLAEITHQREAAKALKPVS